MGLVLIDDGTVVVEKCKEVPWRLGGRPGQTTGNDDNAEKE